MIKTAAMIPSTSTSVLLSASQIRDRALSSSRVVRAGREFCPVVDTLIEFVAGRLAGNGGLGVPYGTSIERGLDAES
jgi:hypothetical protein